MQKWKIVRVLVSDWYDLPPLTNRSTFFQNFRLVEGRMNLKLFRCARHVSIVSLCKKLFFHHHHLWARNNLVFSKMRKFVCFYPFIGNSFKEPQSSIFTSIFRFKLVQNKTLCFLLFFRRISTPFDLSLHSTSFKTLWYVKKSARTSQCHFSDSNRTPDLRKTLNTQESLYCESFKEFLING